VDAGARRGVGAYCEIVAVRLIQLLVLVAVTRLLVWGYGLLGVCAWFVAAGVWAYPGARRWLPDWDPGSDPLTIIPFIVGFPLQQLLNAVAPHAGNVTFVLLHLAFATSVVRADPFPRARLVTRSSCSSG
jgi:hypothetical protein